MLIKEVIKPADDDDEDAEMVDEGVENDEKPKKIRREGFYQPVTMYFRATSPRILEMFPRVVNHPDQVREYMKEIMDKYTRAPPTFLAYRLRRRPESIEEERAAANAAQASANAKALAASSNDRRASHSSKTRSAALRRPVSITKKSLPRRR